MPFALNNALRVFTQIIKKAIHAIREIWRVGCVIYLDDLLILHQDPNQLFIFVPLLWMQDGRVF
jgi:hypothetical protein